MEWRRANMVGKSVENSSVIKRKAYDIFAYAIETKRAAANFSSKMFTGRFYLKNTSNIIMKIATLQHKKIT